MDVTEQAKTECRQNGSSPNTKYFQNIFKRTERKLLETFTINMNKTLAKCLVTIGENISEIMNVNIVMQ